MYESYYKQLLGAGYEPLDENDAEQLFFFLCLDSSIKTMEIAEVDISEMKYVETEYEDDYESIMVFKNQNTGAEIRTKVVYEDNFKSVII